MDTRILSVLEKLKEEWDITPREDYNIEDGIYRRKRNAREAHALVIVWLNSLPVTLFELERILVILQQQKIIESFRLGEEILTINFPVNFDEKYIELTTKQGKKEESSTPNLEKLEDVVENEKKRCLKIESGDKHRMFRDHWLNTKRVFDTLHTKMLSGLDGKEKKEISISSEEFSTHRVSERQKHIIPETIENLERRNIISSRRDKEGNWILEIKDEPALRACSRSLPPCTLKYENHQQNKKRVCPVPPTRAISQKSSSKGSSRYLNLPEKRQNREGLTSTKYVALSCTYSSPVVSGECFQKTSRNGEQCMSIFSFGAKRKQKTPRASSRKS